MRRAGLRQKLYVSKKIDLGNEDLWIQIVDISANAIGCCDFLRSLQGPIQAMAKN